MMPNLEQKRNDRSIKLHIMCGFSSIAILVATIGFWAATTEIAGAVLASGNFVVDTNVKKVQHHKGGVVDAIYVKDGDEVSAGTLLMRLDATQATANHSIVSSRLIELKARHVRLIAERDELPMLHFPDEVTKRQQEESVKTTINSERRLFDLRRSARNSRKEQLQERIEQYGYEVQALKAQTDAYDEGLVVLNSEIASLTTLHQKGVVSVQRLNSLRTQAVSYQGERGERLAQQAQTLGKITETRLQILAIDQDMRAEVANELREVEGQIVEYQERQLAAEDDLKRLDIISPQAGIVHQMAVHTIGGVINQAETLLLIVPNKDDLALDVKIAPRDIDQVKLGQEATLRLTAFNQRQTAEVKGTVTRTGADLVTDSVTGLSYFPVRITITEKEPNKQPNVQLLPGMPADAMILTEQRTALSYFMKPLSDQITRAFREE